MKLVDLVPYLIDPSRLEELLQVSHLEGESEALIIYLERILDLGAEIRFFPIEETKDEILFTKDGVTYIQFFPLDYAVELIESDLELKNRGYSVLEIASRLLEYRVNDA